MADITSIFGGAFVPPPETQDKIMDAPDVQLMTAIANFGYTPPKNIVFDGEIHRFSTIQGKKDNTGWYVAYGGDIHAGAFGCWRDGSTTTWCEELGRELSVAEQIQNTNRLKKIKDQAAKAREKKAGVAADTSREIWRNAIDADDSHPYLSSKRVKSHGLKVTGDGRLIIPVLDSSGDIVSLQFIDSNGDKQFKGNGKTRGGFFCVGSATDMIYLAEGYATAATIHEVTGDQVYVAFNAGNLSHVAEVMRAKHSGKIVIVADNDEHGVGLSKANEAAALIGARVIVPPIIGMDANDYAQEYDLSDLLDQGATTGIIVDADDLCGQAVNLSWLIKHMLQANAFMMMHGASGGGKTFAILDICLHIAAGLPKWFGHKVTQGNVLYLAGEGQYGIKNRIMAWKQYHKVDSLNGRLKVFPIAVDLDADGLMQIISEIEAIGFNPDMIVIDTLNRYMSGDENRSNETRQMINQCAELQRKYSASILLVHHTGNSEEAQHRARGSSAWKGALDIEFSVTPATESTPIIIKQMKSKDTELAQPVYAKLETVYLDGQFDEDGEQISSAVLIEAEKPPEPKSKTFNHEIGMFNQIWSETGEERLFGCKYITSSAIKNWLVKNGTPESTAKQYVKPSFKNGTMAKMAAADLVKHEGAGWILLQTPQEAADKLLSNGL